jgi:drug/metabolite transporter (DMT)-like permease
MPDADGAFSGPRAWRIYGGFAALALLAGPVHSFAGEAFGLAGLLPAEGGYAAAGFFAGTALVSVALLRRERMLVRKEWLAVAGLIVPQLLAAVVGEKMRHNTPWGVTLLIGVGAPLWLGLLAALEMVGMATPRAAVGAGIVGVGAVCLVIPADVYRVAPQQAIALLLHLLIAMLMVYSWAYAQTRLASVGVLMCAGCYLVMNGIVQVGWAVSLRRGTGPIDDWRPVALSILAGVVVMGCLWPLWFWLLRRMTLAALCMGALAAWVASLLPELALGGVRQWRMDVAVMIAVAAVVVGVRARVPEEQPMALGLSER